MRQCKICNNKEIDILLDCGQQALCNRFIKKVDEVEYKFPLVLGQCASCGLVQLIDTVPTCEIKPRVHWLEYNEPEGHLDCLGSVIINLEGITSDSVACGITYKDDTLLTRLNKEKSIKTWRIDPSSDLNLNSSGICTETILPLLTEGNIDRIVQKYGQVDILIARHVYEHSAETKSLISNIKKMVRPGGYIVFEVPDCLPLLQNNDYTMPWEEHILYFTPYTLKNSFRYFGLEQVYFNSFSYPIENALLSIVKKQQKAGFDKVVLNAKEIDIAASYSCAFDFSKNKICNYLKTFTESGKKVVVFGAGHIASTFINIMGIQDYIEFVVDDDVNKKGLCMPGSKLEIKGSDLLLKDNIDLCLLTLNPDSESKVIEKNKKFINCGGKFASVFTMSKNALEI